MPRQRRNVSCNTCIVASLLVCCAIAFCYNDVVLVTEAFVPSTKRTTYWFNVRSSTSTSTSSCPRYATLKEKLSSSSSSSNNTSTVQDEVKTLIVDTDVRKGTLMESTFFVSSSEKEKSTDQNTNKNTYQLFDVFLGAAQKASNELFNGNKNNNFKKINSESTSSKNQQESSVTTSTLKNNNDDNKENNTDELLNAFAGAAQKAGNEFFTFLRMNAAQALTKSLPDEQRKELIQRVIPTATSTTTASASSLPTTTAPPLPIITTTTSSSSTTIKTMLSTKDKTEGKDSKDDDSEGEENVISAANYIFESSKTVSEKISSLELEIAKTEKDLKLVLQKAKQAATARVKNELAIQQQKLIQLQQKQVEEEEIEDNLREESSDQNKEITKTEEGVDQHPILGKCLVDLGYKRIHTVSADTLASIPVWQKQRIYRHTRAKRMATDKLKTQHLGLPGVILLHEDIESGKLSILDGQHRVGMMQVLLQQRENTSSNNNSDDSLLDLNQVIVEVYPQTISGAQDLFVEVNKAEPIKLIDLPGVVSTKDRTIINAAAEKLGQTYPDMFKPSQRCIPPHINIDNLRDNLYASNALSKHNIKSSKQLYIWIMEQNELLKMKYNNVTDDKIQNVSDRALKKARKFDFYLGMEGSWLYN